MNSNSLCTSTLAGIHRTRVLDKQRAIRPDNDDCQHTQTQNNILVWGVSFAYSLALNTLHKARY